MGVSRDGLFPVSSDTMSAMNWTDSWSAFFDRLSGSFGAHTIENETWMVAVVAGAVAIMVLTPVWTHVRQIVTVVHELGHAVVGIACGRRFTGLVINRDMSGHTVTTGRPRGPGIVLTTLAGYPMPAIIGAGMIAAATAGRAQLMLLIGIVLLLTALLRARSLYTVVALLLVLAGGGWLWWSENITVSTLVVLAVGMLLLIGGWRQFVAVALRGGRRDDPAALAALTAIPAAIWNLAILLLIGLPTWWAAQAVIRLLLSS